MNLLRNLNEAWEGLSMNGLRSALTILGIVIGVGATIAMLSVGRGAEAEITGQIESIGTNMLFIFRGGAEEVRNPRPLTWKDAQALEDPFSAPSVLAVAPIIQASREVSYLGETIITEVVGVTPEYAIVRDWPNLEGEFINDAQVLGKSNVVVLGVKVADKLFGYRSGVTGAVIRIENQPYRVIGVLDEKGGSQFGDWDDRVFIPLSTAQTRLIRRGLSGQVDIILVQAVTANAVPQAQEEINQVLRVRHNAPIGEDDFTVFKQTDFLSAVSTITGVLTIFLGGIAAISLLVGGIGIMNIMLVSVVERTREIGLRKALGARKIDILIQFLTEATLLSFSGGIGGVMLGYAIARLVEWIATLYDAAITPVMGWDIILLATLFSTVVGLFFGLYPAYRAAQLQPVEALRSD
jgi:putative ABC transport system permease protein